MNLEIRRQHVSELRGILPETLRRERHEGLLLWDVAVEVYRISLDEPRAPNMSAKVTSKIPRGMPVCQPRNRTKTILLMTADTRHRATLPAEAQDRRLGVILSISGLLSGVGPRRGRLEASVGRTQFAAA
jgi:hypothetical protein